MTERTKSFAGLAELLRRAQQRDGEDELATENTDGDAQRAALTPAQVAKTAAAVVKAGAQRRGELEIPFAAPPQPRQTPLTPEEVRSTAAAIVAAGKKRRGAA